jgi:hypothetical protein
MNEPNINSALTDPETRTSSDRLTRFVMERKGKIEDLDRSFDIEFWQRQGAAAIFSAAWELVEHYHTDRGKSLDELRLQRTVEDFQRLSG